MALKFFLAASALEHLNLLELSELVLVVLACALKLACFGLQALNLMVVFELQILLEVCEILGLLFALVALGSELPFSGDQLTLVIKSLPLETLYLQLLVLRDRLLANLMDTILGERCCFI